jgi:hypothetical protein
MRNFYKVTGGVNTLPVMMDLCRHVDIWNTDQIRKTWSKDSPHVDVDDVLVRFSDTADEKIGDQLMCSWTDSAAKVPSCRAICMALMATVSGEQLGRVLITRLAPGKTIRPHADLIGEYAHFYTRFHVPIMSKPGVLFRAGDETVNMAPGEIWWFNGHLEHEVINNSDADRINLIIDIRCT